MATQDILPAQDASPTLPAPEPKAVLEVVGGIHAGVAVAFKKSAYSIGSGSKADIVLGDRGVAAEHCLVRLQGHSVQGYSVQGYSVIVEATGGDIGVGHDRILQGRGCRVKIPVELRLGNAVLKIAPLRAAPSWFGSWGAARLAAVGAGGCALLLLTSGFDTGAGFSRLSLATLPGGAPSHPAGLTASPVEGVPAATSSSPAPRTRVSAAPRTAPEAVIGALSAKLNEAGMIDVSPRVEGTRVVVSGTISHEQRGPWLEIQRWFDRLHGDGYVLASSVETRAPSAHPKFDLQAVSFGETPYVITGDGQRRYAGAALDKGWIIKEISAGRLTITKDGREIVLSF